MSVISTTSTTERLSRRLQRAGLNYWIGVSSGDALGKYLLVRCGGACVGGAGWNIADAKAKVEQLLTEAKS